MIPTLRFSTNVNGRRLRIPREFAGILPVSPSRALCPFEPVCFHALSTCVEPGMVVYDVGASFGIISALICQLTGKNGRVICFEPNPASQKLAAILLEKNSFSPRVQLVNALVGEKTSTGVPFFFVPGRRSVSSTRNTDIVHFHPDAVPVALDMIALDDFEGPPPAVIKVDIEGGEYQLLLGARRLLQDHHPDLVIETHGLEIDGIGGNALQLCQFLERSGYQLWNLETGAVTDSRSFEQSHARVLGNLLATTRLEQLVSRLAH